MSLQGLMALIEGSDYFWIGLTLSAYLLGIGVSRRLRHPLLNPFLIGLLLLIAVLSLLGVELPRYERAVRPVSLLLTPATVCLAIPLYRQLPLLKRHVGAVLVGILMGVISNALCLAVLGALFGLSPSQFATLLPKSLTTAIGIGLSAEMGGVVNITIAAIFVSGIFGNVTASKVCALCGIREPLAVGLAIGTSSHALGTVRALELGEVEGAMSGLAIVITGLMTVAGAPLLMPVMDVMTRLF